MLRCEMENYFVGEGILVPFGNFFIVRIFEGGRILIVFNLLLQNRELPIRLVQFACRQSKYIYFLNRLSHFNSFWYKTYRWLG